MNHMPQIEWEIVMPTVIVVCTGILGLLVEMFRPKQNNNAIVGISLLGLVLAGVSLVNQIGLPSAATLNGMVFRDQFAVLVQLLMVIVTAVCFVFSEGYLRQKRIAFGEFYPLALWSLSGGMIMVGTKSLLMLFIGLEVLSIALYCLAGMSRSEQKSEESALKYFLLGAFASAFFLYGIAMVYGATGRIDLTAFQECVMEGTPNVYSLGLFGLCLILVGIGFKSAFVPFHQWTPDVYQGAPTNVTAFMAAVSKAAAFGALYRVLNAAVDFQAVWLPALSIVAVATMSVGNLLALVQKDVKRALGYSSIAHAGYLLVGLLAFLKAPGQTNLGGLVFYLLAYSLMTVGAFAVVSLTAKSGEEGTRTSDLNGLWKRAPFAAAALVVFMVSLVGVPPTAGFFGKWFIFMDALNAGLTTLAIVMAVNSAVSAYYYWQILKAAFVDEEPAVKREFGPETAALKLAVAVCAAGILLSVFFVGPFMGVASSAAEGQVQTAYTQPVKMLPPEVGAAVGAGTAPTAPRPGTPGQGFSPGVQTQRDVRRPAQANTQNPEPGQRVAPAGSR